MQVPSPSIRAQSRGRRGHSGRLGAATSPQSGIKSSFLIALICTTSLRILASASTNEGLERIKLILLLFFFLLLYYSRV